MGSGDPSGLQNRRELASLALVSSTLTRFRQFQPEKYCETSSGILGGSAIRMLLLQADYQLIQHPDFQER